MRSSRGREMRDPEEGPYIRSRNVRMPWTEGQEIKKTAFVRDPESFSILIDWGPISGVLQDGALMVCKSSSSCSANLDVWYFLW